MSDMQVEMKLDLTGNMAARAQQNGQALGRMSATANRSLLLLQKTAQQTGQVIDRMANRYAALATGVAAASGINNVVKMDKSLRSLQITSGKTAAEMKEIQDQLLATSQASHIRIDYSELETGIAQVVEMTGDLDWALANRETLAMTVSASGASGEAVGAFMAELQKLGLTADQTQEAIARMLSQGKEGAFTLQNLAALGPRVISSYAVSGRRGTEMLKEMGAVLQMIRTTSGSADMAATSFEALMRSFSDSKITGALQKKGIQVFDPEELKKGNKVLRPINELMMEIVTKTKGDMSKISAVFTDSEASRAFNSFINEFKDTGKFDKANKFMNVSADPEGLIKDSIIMAESYASLLANLNNAWMEFATNEMGGPLEELAAGLRSLKQEDVQRWMEMGKTLFYVGAGIIAARKAWQAGMAVKTGVDWWRGAGKQKGGAGGSAGGMGRMGAIPVYIVDGPMSTLSDATDADQKKRRKPKSPPSASRWSKVVPKGVGVTTAVVSAAMLVPTLLDDDTSTADKVQATSETVGGAAGAWAGAAAGAALGSFIPVIGTAIGGLIGGALGYAGGEWLGGQAGEQITQSLDLTVKLEGAPGTKAEVTSMKSSSDLNSTVYNGAGMN